MFEKLVNMIFHSNRDADLERYVRVEYRREYDIMCENSAGRVDLRMFLASMAEKDQGVSSR